MAIRLRRGSVALLSGACLLWMMGPAQAGTTPPTPETDFSLTVSPTRLAVQPDDLGKKQVFQVLNQGRLPVEVEVRRADFTSRLDGTLLFRPGAAYSARDWATVTPRRFRLAAGRSAPVSVRIRVPADPEPGDHQLALVFLVPAGTGTGNIHINRGIGAPVYVAVPGPVDDSAEVTDLRAPGFTLGGPLTFTARVRDTGTVHRDFRGTGRLRLQVNGESVPFPDFTVGRGATREIATTFDPPLLCLCRAAVSLPGGTSTSVTVVVFPLHWLAAMILLGGPLLLMMFLRRRHLARMSAATRVPSGIEEENDVGQPR